MNYPVIFLFQKLRCSKQSVGSENITKLREMCSKEIAENNGIITFEEAMHFQNSEEE